MCHDQLRVDRVVKKSQPQAPLYCLNLTCPRYSYDLNLEFSRASVEFKDWASVLAFVEKSVMSSWNEDIKNGVSHGHEADQTRKDGKENVVEKTSSVERDIWLKSCEMSTKRRRIRKSESQHVGTKEALESQFEDCKNFSLWKNISRQGMTTNNTTVNSRESETEKESLHQMGVIGTNDASLSDCIFDVEDGIGSHLLEPEKGHVNGDFLRNDITNMETEANYANDCFSGSRWKEEVSIDYPYVGCREEGSIWNLDFMPKNASDGVNDDQELLLRSSSWANSLETPLDFGKKSDFHFHDFNAKQNISKFHGNGDADSLSQNFDIFQRAQYESEVANSWPLPKCVGSRTRKDVDADHLKCDKSFSPCGGFFDREELLESSSTRGRELPPFSPLKSFQQTAITYPNLKQKDWDIEDFKEGKGFERRSGVKNCDDIEQFNYDRKEYYQNGLDDRGSSRKFFPTSLNSRAFFASECAGVEKGIWEISPHGHNVYETDSMRSESFHDIYSPTMDKRHKDSTVSWCPSISPNREIEMDHQICEELGLENILRESSGRTYDSPDGNLTDRSDSLVTSETFSPYLDFQSKLSSSKPSVGCSSAISADKGPTLDLRMCQILEPKHRFSNSGCSLRSRRSHSAPPFYKGKKKFLSVKSSLTSSTENSALQTASQVCTASERMQSKHPPKLTSSRTINSQDDKTRFGEDSLVCLEQKVKRTSNVTPVSDWSHIGNTDVACFSSGYLMEVHDSESLLTKWREGCPEASSKEVAKYLTAGDRLKDLKDEDGILDIQSCMLNVAGDSLVPKSINRNGLQNAKVLWQIDNKYIPVVADGTLAVIDQHAADERIRLEEMRQKVLSGEMKSICYLEKEKDLVLPEMAYQLLCNYSEHIKHWGWICNIFCQDSGSFAKNMNLLNERPSNLTLMAVPCILGVNLSDSDLVEFLEQLADTDGSSTIPPSVVRVLNNKACRGAIMFGDKLLPSECSLIVEELKQTSLCFQCAHGRPTTVPLVNLKALHKGILHLGSWHDRPKNTWHGLCRKKITLNRAKRRLNAARGCD